MFVCVYIFTSLPNLYFILPKLLNQRYKFKKRIFDLKRSTCRVSKMHEHTNACPLGRVIVGENSFQKKAGVYFNVFWYFRKNAFFKKNILICVVRVNGFEIFSFFYYFFLIQQSGPIFPFFLTTFEQFTGVK